MDKNTLKQFEEIRKLYDLNEAEEQCLIHMSLMVKLLGYSPKLTIKLLRALTAFYEVIHDEMYRQGEKK